MNVAFVVLTYNRPDALLEVLRGLAEQCGYGHEVLIADDGSAPGAVAALKAGLPQFDCPVRHAWHPDVGFTAARARNLAASLSPADYLIFMDGDCIPNARFVENHLRLAQAGCFVNGSRVLLSETLTGRVVTGQTDIRHARFGDWARWRLAGDVNKVLHLFPWPQAPGRKERAFRWKGIRSCNLAVWREDFVRVNGFDQSFEGWGHEDADLVLRLHNAGVDRKNGFLATEVYHLWHRENSRASESANRATVMQRIRSGEVRALQGLDEAMASRDAVVTPLN